MFTLNEKQELGLFQHAELISRKSDCTMTTVRKHIDEISTMSEERAKEIGAMSDDDIDYSDIPRYFI